jgi:hypothetical protein
MTGDGKDHSIVCIIHLLVSFPWMVHRMSTVPDRISKWMAVMLLSVISAAAAVGPDPALMSVTQSQPAGCHHHGGAPSSGPVSYRCCQSGHDSAILQSSLGSQLDSADLTSAADSSQNKTPTITHRNLRKLALPSADPPETTPLRI